MGSSIPTSKHTSGEFQITSWHMRLFTTGPCGLLQPLPLQYPAGTETAHCYPHSPHPFTFQAFFEGHLCADEVLSTP